MADGNGCVNCPYKQTIDDLKKDSERNTSQHKDFYKKIGDLETLLAVHGERYSNLLTMMTEIKVAVEGLKEKPSKKWDNVTTYVITAIIGAVIGALAGKL